MPELIAQGTQPAHRWRRTLPSEASIELGRVTPSFAVPWDNQISRRHIRLVSRGDRLNVMRLETAANPVFLNGTQEDTFWLSPGEHFVIGETTFTLTADRAEATLDVPDPIRQQTFTHEFLQHVRYRDADRRLEVLSGLPELITSASDASDLLNRMVNTMLEGIQSAVSVGVVQVPVQLPIVADQKVADADPPEVLHWDRRSLSSGDFHPSTRLITQAMQTQQSVLHLWHAASEDPAAYTIDVQNDWAFCCPIDSQATQRWAIYVTGTNHGNNDRDGATGGAIAPSVESSRDSGTGAIDLQGDVKFCELVGATLKNLLLVRQLEQRQTSLRQFFSPLVLQAIANQDPNVVLSPRECRVSVMFCDLRGFARASERLADDLPDLLRRTSEALGIITRCILENGGVIGDFHGDAVMGFWGWPLEPAEDRVLARQAAAAAVQIQTEFAAMASDPQNALHDFRVGIGVATGQAVAGKIGTRDQVKVTAFGPVVNLASRLEGMNRRLETQVLLDEATANALDEKSRLATNVRLRRLGRFQPYGISMAANVYQLLDASFGPNEHLLAAFGAALTAFEQGDWVTARGLLEDLDGATDDAGCRFLKSRLEGDVPGDWDGVIQMESK